MTQLFRINPGTSIGLPRAPLAVLLAGRDLALDVGRVCGTPAILTHREDAPIVGIIEPNDSTPEAWSICVTPSQVRIVGADTLGLIYGLYAISEQFLGVDPFWFWKELEPAPREVIELEPQVIQSRPAAFRYRGWFVNDEDLLTGWLDGGLPRELDYPHYQTVVHPDAIERVLEALLRSGGNLVIPASFVNILEPAERNLIEQSVARGLYVSQHHIEPMGVSLFSFETYWKRRGEPSKFAFGADPDRVRETWRVYAREWARVAGTQVIWQLGLRGRGDRPVWHHDPSITPEQAPRFISQALQDQWDIVREVDPRPHPPATMTLWDEGSQMMADGSLQLPESVIAVFCDRGASQTMQEDFYKTLRLPGRQYGSYYHLAYWGSGPHLAQGVCPEKIHAVYGNLIRKGDTAYTIVNVSSVREMVVGLSALMEIVQQGLTWNPQAFWTTHVDPALHDLYGRYFGAILKFKLGIHHSVVITRDLDHRTLSDGESRQLINQLMRKLRDPNCVYAESLMLDGCDDLSDCALALRRSSAEFVKIADDACQRLCKLHECQRTFYDANLRVQSRIMAGLYQCAAELIASLDNRAGVAAAAAAIAGVLHDRNDAARGRWKNWYRGDRKMNLPRLLQELKTLAETAST